MESVILIVLFVFIRMIKNIPRNFSNSRKVIVIFMEEYFQSIHNNIDLKSFLDILEVGEDVVVYY